MISRSIFLAIWLVLAATHGVRAQDTVSYPAPGDALPSTPGVTYADLLRLVVPDMEVKDAGFVGSSLIDLRHIDAEFGEMEALEKVETHQIVAIPVGNPDDARLALFFDLGVSARGAEGFAVLALFDLSAAPSLLDVANVAFDRFTFPLNPYRLDLGEADLLLTASTHHNSSQGYAIVPLVLVHDDRLNLIDAIFLFDDSGCAYHRVQRIDFATGPGETFADIVATVTEATDPTGGDCGGAQVPEPPERTIAVTYRWDAAQARYVPDSDAFEVLAAGNEQRF